MENDLKQEQFLKRIDLRIQAISCIFANHEQWLVGTCVADRKRLQRYNDDINNFQKDLLERVEKIDNDIKSYFDEIYKNTTE